MLKSFLTPRRAALTMLAWTIPVILAQQPPSPDFTQPGPPQETVSPRRPAEAATLVPPVRPFRLPARVGVETQMEITLDQALSMALANNKDIESSRIDRLESEYTLTAAQGAFDPQLSVNSYWQQQINPVASSLGGSATGSLLNKTWLGDPGSRSHCLGSAERSRRICHPRARIPTTPSCR